MKAFLLATSVLVGCGGGNSEVAMKGGDIDLARIAGDWQGNYKGIESGREGPITFSLAMGHHTADGTVLMGGSTPIKIQFVGIAHDKLSGKIAPYTDPSCSCQVQTEFLGDVGASGTIEGTFTTTVIGKGLEQHGTWSVKRAAQ
jgi:hypothetical protein